MGKIARIQAQEVSNITEEFKGLNSDATPVINIFLIPIFNIKKIIKIEANLIFIIYVHANKKIMTQILIYFFKINYMHKNLYILLIG